MENAEIEKLLVKYQEGTASEKEVALLESWYLLRGEDLSPYKGEIDYEAKRQEIWQAITNKRQKQDKPTYQLWRSLSAVASIILAIGIGFYFYIHRSKEPIEQAEVVKNDAAPGSSKAVLTLSDGRKVELDASAKDTISRQGSTSITKANGTLQYVANGVAAITAFNTITTPKGGEYQVILPDGTHVWLNAASSLIYPVAFTGKERKVEVTGEAYFEVAHNRAKPFRVGSALQTVEVLGTHFNINAYTDEEGIKTTLLEGAVKVQQGKSLAILKPGKQSIAANGIAINDADVDAVVAWKNGKTYFKDADIPTMMRALSRWYNVDVVFSGRIPTRTFTGGIPRKSNLSTLLKILNEMNIHAQIEGRKIIVTP